MLEYSMLPNSAWLLASSPFNEVSGEQLAGVLGIFALILLVGMFISVVISSIFVHIAAKILGFGEGFGVAIKSQLIYLVIAVIVNILIGMAAGFLGPNDQSIQIAAGVGIILSEVACGCYAIKWAYDIGLGKAFIAYMLSKFIVVVFIVAVIFLFVVPALMM